MFAAAPFLLVRLQGHLNVLSAWGLPLVAALIITYERRPSAARAAWIGLAVAAPAYVDYYAFVFATVLAGFYLMLSSWHVEALRRPLGRGRARAFWAATALVAVVSLVAATIAITGGTQAQIAGMRISMRSSSNLRVAAGLLAAIAAVLWWWPRVSVRRVERRDPRLWRTLPVAIVLCAVLLLPLIAAGVRLFADGDYVSQQYRWERAVGH
jgi:hypothetical protein